MQSHTEEQRGKRACALTARGSFSDAMKGLAGGASQGSADCRKNWTTAFRRSSGCGTDPSGVERAQAYSLERYIQGSSRCYERTRAQQNRSGVGAPGPTGERQQCTGNMPVVVQRLVQLSSGADRGGAVHWQTDQCLGWTGCSGSTVANQTRDSHQAP